MEKIANFHRVMKRSDQDHNVRLASMQLVSRFVVRSFALARVYLIPNSLTSGSTSILQTFRLYRLLEFSIVSKTDTGRRTPDKQAGKSSAPMQELRGKH